jgi:hypothetical protein
MINCDKLLVSLRSLQEAFSVKHSENFPSVFGGHILFMKISILKDIGFLHLVLTSDPKESEGSYSYL